MAVAREQNPAEKHAPRPRVLMLTHRVPYPPDRGDRIRAYHLLKALAGRFDVTLAAVADEPIDRATHAELGRLAREVLLAEARPMHRRALAAKAMLTGHAITPAALMERDLARRIVDRQREQPFETVLTYCTGMIGYVQALHAASHQPFRHVLDLVDVDSLKWSRFAEQTRGPMRLVYAAEARRLRAVEAGRVVPFDALTVISEHEAEQYRQHVGTLHRPVVVGNGVDLQRFYPADADQNTHDINTEPTLIFTGVMSYKPNIDAAVWFARRVMPRIRAALPQARFDIVGKSPAPAVGALDELPGVRVVGPVADTAEHLRRAAAAIAPMRIAPGVQNKVLEAMACGLPVVCSSAAAAGIDAAPGRHLLVADSEADAAAQCVRLLLHPGYRAELGTDARQRIEQRYRWEQAAAPMLELLQPAAPAEATR